MGIEFNRGVQRLETTFRDLQKEHSSPIIQGALTVAIGIIALHRFREGEQLIKKIDNQTSLSAVSLQVQDKIKTNSLYKNFCEANNFSIDEGLNHLDQFKSELLLRKEDYKMEVEKGMAILHMMALAITNSLNGNIVNKLDMTLDQDIANTKKKTETWLSKGLFIMSGVSKSKLHEAYEKETMKEYKKESIEVTTATGTRHIEAWQQIFNDDLARLANNQPLERPTVVLFHPNGSSGSGMELLARLYISKGYNVLLPTMGGYPGSPGVVTSEKSAYQDIEAIKLYLASQGISKVGFHGISLGGALAVHAGATENPQGMKSLFVVADQTFSSAADVGENLTANCIGRGLGKIGRKIMEAALPTGEIVDLPGGKQVLTDGFNNLAKMDDLKKNNVPVQFITASHDRFMGSGKSTDKDGFERNCADEMSARYYGKDTAHDHIIRMEDKQHAIPINAYFGKKDFERVRSEKNQFLKLIPDPKTV